MAGVSPEALPQDVGVSNRSQPGRESAKLGAQHPAPAGIEQGLKRSKIGPESASRHAHLMDGLDIFVQVKAGQVHNEPLDGRADGVLDHRAGRGLLPRMWGCRDGAYVQLTA